jgi:hypothetical protein
MSHPLDGRWRVRRRTGVLVPGFSKRMHDAGGCTYLWGIPIGRFRVRETPTGCALEYVRWPIVDELEPRDDGAWWHGNGRVFGHTFCAFSLERLRDSSTN